MRQVNLRNSFRSSPRSASITAVLTLPGESAFVLLLITDARWQQKIMY
jgi:hypothetical protein